MLKKAEPFILSADDEERMHMAEWIWQSHNWVEETAGYYHCKWCDRWHTSQMAVRFDDHLCPKNPAVLKLLLDK